MKSIRTLTAIALTILAATAVFAQSSSRLLMKIDIPFAFIVDDRTLPAGQYFVTDVSCEHVIALTSADGKHSLMVHDLPNYASKSSSNSRMVFQRYGSEYFLTQVWTSGDNVARNPLVSKRQVEIAHSGARSESTVILAEARF